MADENIDLQFLAEQGKRILDELGDVRAEQKSLAEIVGKVADAVTAVATRQDHHTEVLTRHSELLDKLSDPAEQRSAFKRDRGPPRHHRASHRAHKGLNALDDIQGSHRSGHPQGKST